MAKNKYEFCTTHHKYLYASNGEAACSAARVLSYRKRFALRVYPCSINEGKWHLTKRTGR